MTRPADRQRSRVYAWEDIVVTVADTSVIPFSLAQGMVDAIWSELGLRFPPKVERLPRQSRRLQADGSRLRLRLPDRVPSWLLLHEVAHALSSTADGTSDGHGSAFMGLYIRLLTLYLRMPAATLIGSATEAGIVVDTEARPFFADQTASPGKQRPTGADPVLSVARRT
ncbi:MAG: hypothetical protein ACRYF2_24810 [Janthinobacterium lividum]